LKPFEEKTVSKYRDRAEGFAAGQKAEERPPVVTDDHLSYLDDLRESGATNMYGARPYLMDAFPELDEEKASTVLGYWMKTFGNPDR
jgi:hypothetical protein